MLFFVTQENITVVSQPPVNTKTGIVRSCFQNCNYKRVGASAAGKWGHYIKSLMRTSNKNRHGSDRRSLPWHSEEQKTKLPFLRCLAAAWSMFSVITQTSPQTFGAGCKLCRNSGTFTSDRQTVVLPGLSPASAFGGQSPLISRTSFRRTV